MRIIRGEIAGIFVEPHTSIHRYRLLTRSCALTVSGYFDDNHKCSTNGDSVRNILKRLKFLV